MLKDILSTFNYIIFYNTNADSDLDFWKKLRSFSPQEFVEGWINKFIERVDGVKRKGDILLLGASNKIFDKIDQNENYKHKICKYRMYQTPNISEFLEKEMLINFKKNGNENLIVFLDFTGVDGKVILNPLPSFMKNVKRVIYDNDFSRWSYLCPVLTEIYPDMENIRNKNRIFHLENFTLKPDLFNEDILKGHAIYIDSILKEQIQCGKYPHLTPELSNNLDEIIKSDKVNFPDDVQIYSLSYLFYFLQCNRLIIYKHGSIPIKPEIRAELQKTSNFAIQNKPQIKKKSEIVPLIKIALSILKGTQLNYPFDKENLQNLQTDFWLFLEQLNVKSINKQRFISQIQESIS